MNSMIKGFNNDFSIKIDTSACKSLIAGHDINLNDTWLYSDQVFESGKIYGIVRNMVKVVSICHIYLVDESSLRMLRFTVMAA